VKTGCYLVFNKRGSVRAVVNYPQLGSGEFAVKLRLEVPDEFFKPEVPTIDLTINSRDVIVPVVVVDGEQVP
jgi:hypothetical protein